MKSLDVSIPHCPKYICLSSCKAYLVEGEWADTSVILASSIVLNTKIMVTSPRHKLGEYWTSFSFEGRIDPTNEPITLMQINDNHFQSLFKVPNGFKRCVVCHKANSQSSQSSHRCQEISPVFDDSSVPYPLEHLQKFYIVLNRIQREQEQIYASFATEPSRSEASAENSESSLIVTEGTSVSEQGAIYKDIVERNKEAGHSYADVVRKSSSKRKASNDLPKDSGQQSKKGKITPGFQVQNKYCKE